MQTKHFYQNIEEVSIFDGTNKENIFIKIIELVVLYPLIAEVSNLLRFYSKPRL